MHISMLGMLIHYASRDWDTAAWVQQGVPVHNRDGEELWKVYICAYVCIHVCICIIVYVQLPNSTDLAEIAVREGGRHL